MHTSETSRELLSALEGIFEHCALIHKHWGEGCNAKEAKAAEAKAHAAIANAKAGEPIDRCDDCDAPTDDGVSCPDGAFICRRCFDAGAH